MTRHTLTVVAAGLAAFTMLALTSLQTPARADEVRSWSCVGGYGLFNCVTSSRASRKDSNIVSAAEPGPARNDPESKERERHWIARCNPVVRQDDFGVPRYVYSAPGCEFGRYH